MWFLQTGKGTVFQFLALLGYRVPLSVLLIPGYLMGQTLRRFLLLALQFFLSWCNEPLTAAGHDPPHRREYRLDCSE